MNQQTEDRESLTSGQAELVALQDEDSDRVVNCPGVTCSAFLVGMRHAHRADGSYVAGPGSTS